MCAHSKTGLLACLLVAISSSASAQAPVVPVGLDAYRMWDRWPYQRIGVRAYMRSTYDRTGGNERADASHFLYQLAEDRNVTLDVEGPGLLYFVRYNHWHGSPWHYEVDGLDHMVRETSTVDPEHPAPDSVFQPESAFPKPLAWTWADTKGGDLSWVPIGFEKRFRMAYSRTFYGTGYYIYHQFVAGTKLTRPITAWREEAPDQDVLDLIGRAGSDIAPAGMHEASGTLTAGQAGHPLGPPANSQLPVTLWTARGPATIRTLELSVPREQALAFSAARLRITWDGRSAPSVDAPVGLFFGAGLLYNRDNREYLVKSFPMTVRYTRDRVYLSCYLPMPFFRSARIELAGSPAVDVQWRVATIPYKDPPNQAAYLHATYRDHPSPELGKDLVLLDTRQTEGGGNWSGQFIGTSFIFSHDGVLATLEGDPRFFFDDSLTPQAYGTGTEEWGGGGDYWGGLNMTLPFAGHPVGAKSAKDAVSAEDKVESAYRFLLADLMPFGRNAVIRLEHGGTNESNEHYKTVTYWYGLPAASLVATDKLRIGDASSERRHRYFSPQAGAPYELRSRYEWGPDTIDGREIYPAETDRGRITKTASEFTLKIDPRNLGVMLRRKLDYGFPNQRALVFVAVGKEWKPAGVWYLAGSNTCVFSSPRAELGAALHVVETSNRRFRDDEFLLPLELTRGRSAIRVRVKFTPVETPLYPDYPKSHPLPELAWSEMRYTAYSYVMPRL
jgi:hypothetical protein